MSLARSSSKVKTQLAGSAAVFAALGDDTRLWLVSRLCEGGPLSIVRLAEGSDLTRQAITKHLHVLGEAGLARSLRDGRESLWELEPKRLEEARRYLDAVSKRWDKALDRLKALVEDET
jgi:DNA-binding transcriptional ArsR family regulator